jgi:putative NADH-flavin reductase
VKITVIGASGGTGAHVVRQALARGDQVTAVVRLDPARLPVPAEPGLEIVVADALDADQLVPALQGRDAVVSALGPRKGEQVPVLGAGARALAAALPAAGVRRAVLVSAAPLAPGGEGPVTRLVVKPVLLRLLRKAYDDLREMEAVMRASDLDWTVVRPPMLSNGAHTGRYRRADGLAVRGGRRLSRADTADACLAVLGDPATVRRAIAVAY